MGAAHSNMDSTAVVYFPPSPFIRFSQDVPEEYLSSSQYSLVPKTNTYPKTYVLLVSDILKALLPTLLSQRLDFFLTLPL